MIAKLLSTLIDLSAAPRQVERELSVTTERTTYGVRLCFGDGSKIELTEAEARRVAQCLEVRA